ncbi:Cytosolic copper metallochaperone [Haplosporangium sp. Z 11]|nr:Cytosolic copper metallochaperone [Haplosporangium sp. Z 11]
MTQFKFNVTMSCGGCSGAVTKALNNLPGVNKCEVSLENQTATVESSSLTEAEILAAIQKTGKSVKVADP